MDPTREHWWAAQYRGDGSTEVVEGVHTNECPVSLITKYSQTLISISQKATALTGVVSLGDSETVPAKLVDGLEVIAQEKGKAEWAEHQAGPRIREEVVEMED